MLLLSGVLRTCGCTPTPDLSASAAVGTVPAIHTEDGIVRRFDLRSLTA